MNSKTLMTVSSLFLGVAGLMALFAPDALLGSQDVSASRSIAVIVQLMGALYFAFALINWTAKDSAIGGIYARPVSFGNFAHFFAGTLILVKYVLSTNFNGIVLLVTLIYTVFAILFYWLVFRATGLPKNT